MLAARGGGGRVIFDDFREAYYWLRHNTPEVGLSEGEEEEEDKEGKEEEEIEKKEKEEGREIISPIFVFRTSLPLKLMAQ